MTRKHTGKILTNVRSVADFRVHSALTRHQVIHMERNLTNVVSVARVSIENHTWKVIRAFIQERNNRNVMSLVEPLAGGQAQLTIRSSKLEKNLTNVVSVAKPLGCLPA